MHRTSAPCASFCSLYSDHLCFIFNQSETCEVITFFLTMSSPKSTKDKTFYIAEHPYPTDDSIPIPVLRSNTGETRVRSSTPDTTATAANSDPFATPVSSRPPSIRHIQPHSSPNASRVSFADSVATGLRNRPPLTGNQLSAFSSARSSSRISSTPITITGTSPGQGATNPKLKAPRMRSHMLSDSIPIPKPWKNNKSTRAVLSYWIVYFIIFLGIAGGAFQCYWTYIHVPLDKQPLCIVLDENFDNEDAVFGPGGTFFREVNMDGFG